MQRPQAATTGRPVADTDNDKSRSVMTIIMELVNDIPKLFRKELELLRTELDEKARQIGSAGIGIAVGLLLSLAALMILLQALVLALSNVVPPWLAAVIVGVAVAAVAFVMIHKGQRDLKAASLVPQRTLDQVNEDAQMVKEKMK